jgi:KaiC/GvpD/RAD55 family RecA-like ATPase
MRAPLPENFLKKDGSVHWSEIIRLAKVGMQKTASESVMAALTGHVPPNSPDIEEVVLGACLIDGTAFEKLAKVFHGQKPFYKDVHQHIYDAMFALHSAPIESDRRIDRLTVFMKMTELKTVQHMNQGNPYYLVELSSTVSSTAHIESHARLLLQLHVDRQIIDLCMSTVQKVHTQSGDTLKRLGELSENAAKLHINTLAKDRITRRQSGAEILQMCMDAQDSRRLVGDLLSEGGITLLFAPAKVGKTVASIMFGVNLAQGVAAMNVLANEVGPRKVLYFDFELTERDWKKRYSDDDGNFFNFKAINDNFIRISEAVDFTDYAVFSSKILPEIKMWVESEKPDIIIVDNLTFITDGSLDPKIATLLMKELKGINKKYNTSIMVLAHVPKQNGKFPITENTMAGSAQLKNFATDVVGIARSGFGKGHIYIKHLISRSREVELDETKTIHAQIEKKGAFLGLTFLGFREESEHLLSIDEKEEMEEMLQEAYELQSTLSLRQIIAKLKMPISHMTLKRKLDAMQKQKKGGDNNKDWDEALQNKPVSTPTTDSPEESATF